jgi:predicted dehydrogenase
MQKAKATVEPFDINPERGKAIGTLRAEHHQRPYDAAVITSPAEEHYALTLECLQMGLHCFVTKPLTLRGQEARELAAHARDRGLVLWVDHTFLHAIGYAEVEDCIRRGVFGDVVRIESVRVNSWGNGPDVVHDLAPHDLSIWQWWLRRNPTSIHVEHCGTKAAHLLARYGDIPCHAYLAWDHAEKVRKMTVIGSKRSVQVNGNCVTWYENGRPTESKWDSLETPLEREARRFLERIAAGGPWVGPNDPVAIVEQIEAALASAEGT